MSNKFILSNGKFVLSGNKLGIKNDSTPIMPTKGQLINMNLGNDTPAGGTNNQYRVLSVNNSVAEVIAMYDMPSISFNAAAVKNVYNGGELDTYLNSTFYNSLNNEAKAAIVDKDIVQYEYAYNEDVYNESTHVSYADYSTKNIKENIGNRHIYALDIDDIETYFNSTFSNSNI